MSSNRHHIVKSIVLTVGAISMFVSLAYDMATFASEDYRNPLAISFVALLIATISCGYVLAFKGVMRWIAAPVLLPGIFVLLDFLRRAPSVYGW